MEKFSFYNSDNNFKFAYQLKRESGCIIFVQISSNNYDTLSSKTNIT